MSQEYKLWENGAPLFDPEIGQPEPTLTSYLLEGAQSDGSRRGCVIVCPGGAYWGRADHEGRPIAEMLNEAGISAFVLNYRVQPYRYPVERYDVNRAVRYVRYYADKFEIDPEKIGVLGFSAGGHLAVMSVEQYDYGMENGDEIDKISSRPDSGILCYPVVTLEKSFTHEGTRDALLGTPNDPELAKKLSGEVSVRDDMPPIFMWHTAADGGVPVLNSLKLSEELYEHKIPFALHVFPFGQHGLGLAPGNPHVAQWAPLLVNWLKLYKY